MSYQKRDESSGESASERETHYRAKLSYQERDGERGGAHECERDERMRETGSASPIREIFGSRTHVSVAVRQRISNVRPLVRSCHMAGASLLTGELEDPGIAGRSDSLLCLLSLCRREKIFAIFARFSIFSDDCSQRLYLSRLTFQWMNVFFSMVSMIVFDLRFDGPLRVVVGLVEVR